MTTGHVFIAVSLDGYIARPDGAIDWLVEGWPEVGHDYGYTEFIGGVDGLVMGRATFEKVVTFPKWLYEKPVVVLSQTLRASDVPPALADRVRISDAQPGELMQELHRAGWTRAYIDGGKVIQSFLAQGLIEDLVITRLPILIGSGLPLFGAHHPDLRLEHVETTTHPSGFVQSRYAIPRQV
jgi:dihydrofolate reductase